MASGKLTPRQKMINMMYLVLTALLALNVSAEVLESFQQLADTLGKSAEKFSQRNNQLGADIIETIEKDAAARARNEWLIKAVRDVEKETNATIAQIDLIIKDLYNEELTGGGSMEELPTHILNKSETEKNFRYFMISDGQDETANNGEGAGKARELKLMLKKYIDFANNEWKQLTATRDTARGTSTGGDATHFGTLTPPPAELYPNTDAFAEARSHSWEYFNFHGTPIVANLALLQKIKNDVNVVEAELLQQIRQRINNIVFKIDKLVAISAPESQYVIAGMEFKTKIYVTVSSTEMRPNFGAGIRAIDNGQVGEYTTRANGAVIGANSRVGEQAYNLSVSVPKADGTMDVLPVRGTFKVVRPELVYTSEAVDILYANCRNVIKVDCPDLGTAYNPSFQARGGTTETNPQNNKAVGLVPAGGPFQLIVSQNAGGQLLELGRKNYRVIPPPKPTLQFAAGGNMLRSGDNLRIGGRVGIRVIPEPNFARALPNDARYSMANVKVMVKRGLGAPTTLRTINGGATADVATASILEGSRPGEQLILEVSSVNRINFQNRAIQEPFEARELIISLTLQ